MNITLIVVAGLLAAFALTGFVAGFAILRARSIPKEPRPKTRREFVLELLAWSAVIAVHIHRYPQLLWWFVAAGGGWLGLLAAGWYFDPAAKRPQV